MDAKCTSPKFFQEDQPRLRYDRDVILSLRERVLSSDTEALYHIDLNEVAQRSSRAKPTKQVASGRNQSDRPRDTKSIVLGPQKRTWNTGCHVTQSGSREIDASGRPGRSGSEYHMSERHSKPSLEHKREYRNGARGLNRRADGSFSNSYPDKDYKYHHSEEEPEWFSGGPSTVSETIELGGIVEGDGDCTPDDKVQSPITDNALDKIVKLQALCALSPSKPNKSADNVSPQKDSPKFEESPAFTGNPGSRFKHLFSTTDGDVERDKGILQSSDNVSTENVNQQLLRLFKGTANASPADQYQKNVIQVENKLRSLLLGHRLSAANNDHSTEEVENKAAKPKILTVEEIEAQLNLSNAPSQAPSLGAGGSSTHESPANQAATSSSLQAPDAPYRQTPLDSGLASVLQSLASKHQAASSRSTAVHGAFRSLGIFPNPVVRLPTNALSASARINQLQQPEIGTTILGDTAPGVLGHVFDTSADTAVARAGQNQPHMLPSRSGFITGLNPEPITKPASTGLNALPLNLPVPRRPIVKSQLGPNSAALQKHNLGLTDIDRSLSNASTGQQMHTCGEKHLYNHMFPNTYNAPMASNFHEAANISIASTNNNSYFQQRPFCDRPQSENTLEFLSHLVEMDRSSVSFGNRKPTVSLNPLLPVALRAKTLEELERQEVFHTDTFL